MISFNSVFGKLIQKDLKYWEYLQLGLADPDTLCRKQAVTLLKQNLHAFTDQKEIETKFGISQEEFEQLWTIFFDTLDTLESFSTHLIKSIWDRLDLIYCFLQKNFKAYSQIKLFPLLDF